MSKLWTGRTNESGGSLVWRVVGETELFADYGFYPRELAGVYLGTQCSKDDEKEILALLSHGFEHVSAYRALIDGPEVKFIFQRVR
jgi:hypothetical protein